MKKTALRHLIVTVAGLTTTLLSISVLAAPGDLFEADRGSNTIFRFTPDGTKTPFAATGLNGPIALAFDAAGNLFESDFFGNTIFKFTPGGTKSTFASALSGPTDLAFDSSGNLFEADRASGTIFKFAPNGTKTTFAAGLNLPTGLAFDSSGNLFEADNGSNTIFKFAPDGTKTTFVTGLGSPFRLAFDSSGNLFVSELAGTISKITPTGTTSTFASGLGVNNPTGLAFDAFGNLFEADFGSGNIFIFTPAGTKTTFVSALSNPEGLAFEPTLHQLFNISTRGFVGTGDAVLIGGFIVTGNGMVNSKVLIRAAGPSLTAFGVAGALQDPVVRLFNSSGTVIASNDNWKDTQQAAIQATGLAPTDDRESAILASLPAGAFTAIVTGAGNTTGIARVDVFNLP
jgi:sugar lactone lactonase YvrE